MADPGRFRRTSMAFTLTGCVSDYDVGNLCISDDRYSEYADKNEHYPDHGAKENRVSMKGIPKRRGT